MLHFLSEHASALQQKTIEHISLTGFSLFFASVISISLAILIDRIPSLRQVTLKMGSVSQTIPSLGLLALLIPIVGLGDIPTLIVLTFYGIYPILKSTDTGLKGVPLECLEAARGLGFSSFQKLYYVKIPLALPNILSGIRVATAMIIGITTIAAFIGAGGLGDFITQGISLNDPRLILLGTIPAALLAIIFDYGVSQIEKIVQNRERKTYSVSKTKTILLMGIAATFLVLVLTPLLRGPEKVIVIASKNFTEQHILGELMAQLIEAKTPLKVIRKTNLGSIDVIHQALLKGEVDLCAEYSGTAYLTILKYPFQRGMTDVMDKVRKAYEAKFNLVWLKPFGFSNSQTLALKKDFAQAGHIASISDLAKVSKSLTLAAAPEFLKRPDAYPGLSQAYGLVFKKVIQIEPTLSYAALQNNYVDVIGANTTDGKLQKYHLILLKDDSGFYPSYEAAPIIRKETLKKNPQIYEAISPLLGLITQERIIQLNYQVDGAGKSPYDVAKAFLNDFHLIP